MVKYPDTIKKFIKRIKTNFYDWSKEKIKSNAIVLEITKCVFIYMNFTPFAKDL